MGLEGLVEIIITATGISSLVAAALENVRGVITTKDDHWDEVLLILSVAICYAYDIRLLETIAGNVSTLSVGYLIDYVIGGSALAGGGAKLYKRISRDVAKVRKATA